MSIDLENTTRMKKRKREREAEGERMRTKELEQTEKEKKKTITKNIFGRNSTNFWPVTHRSRQKLVEFLPPGIFKYIYRHKLMLRMNECVIEMTRQS